MGIAISQTKYIIISSVKDEEKYIETTIHAVLRQTARPSKWVIVDDGSRDRTPSIVDKYSRRFDWITVLTLARESGRDPGSAIIRAFEAGYRLVQDVDFDFVVKLDCDLDFAPDYFQRLIDKFHQDSALGIASGTYLEKSNSRWLKVPMPAYHAAGASKVVRAKCFREIGGFIPSPGWDTIDEIRALMKGWKTRHFEELSFYHLKDEGSGIGFARTSFMHGEIHYLAGGGPLFFLLKFLHRLVFGRPFLLGGIAMLLGYLKPLISGRQRLVTRTEASFYRHLLNKRIARGLAKLFDWARLRHKSERYT